jgi:hypothetical protein
MLRKSWILALGFLLIAGIAYTGNLNTSGKCPWAAACVLGHANSTSLTLTTDGGDVVMDGSVTSALGMTATTGDITATAGNIIATVGYVEADIRVSTAATGGLSPNRVTVLTATADYTLVDCETTTVGSWHTLIVRDPSETVSISGGDATDVLEVGGLNLDAGDELDSPTAGVTTDGSSITFVCVAADLWMSTQIVGTWVDGGAT